MPEFSHLHVHTQFSLLDGASDIPKMLTKAQNDGMKAVAITDHGNMFGAFKFVAEASKRNIKPIVGCEFYIVDDRTIKSFSKDKPDVRRHQLFLAKNAEGYKNLSKLCSLGYIEGLYSKWPRIDKELVLKYHKGLIATTCCIGAEVPQAILNKGEEYAETLFKWWLDLFGEDYYVELQRHDMEDQEKVNRVLLKFAHKYNVKVIASNDSHYIDQNDSNAHDILLCVNTGELQSTPKGDGRGFRFGFPNDKFYFKTQKEMSALFHDIPEAIDNTGEIVSKIDTLKLKRDILLPSFVLPAGFETMDDFLRHLTFEGALKRYGEITQEIEERLNHELFTIKTMGFPGYFLIVQDFINAAKELGVAVGPGRGSAAGSVVAYCIGITNIDPIKYQLLFERFLNPERVTMPDIDTDFDDEGRDKVIDYVVKKYGKNQVAQIITFGTMAARSSIKDVARVLDLPLAEANLLAKLVPEAPGTTLEKAFADVPELADFKKGTDLKARTLKLAESLEGSVRNTGIHASAIIIAPDDLTDYIPVSTSKDSPLFVTQFDGKVIEDAGMLKMDFLGLKTLTIIKYALALIKKNHGIDIDIDNIPLDDEETYLLFQKGETIGIFQFESDGMSKYLSDLKPTNIEDLIAMAALYRPGPMQFIPNYVNRKHGREKVEYPHDLLEGILKNTYGIMVYQEQIMQTAQIIAGYSLGGADLLRRAMGKKDKEKMAKERIKFVKGAGEKNNIPEEKANDIFDVMERFAEYGFNRSHSAAYSVVAYQTAYLKAHYPAEFMAAILTNNMSSIENITFFIEESRRQGIKVLGPDVNESGFNFTVNKKGAIRMGLGAVKGVGEGAVMAIIDERNENGPFTEVFEMVQRINLRSANKRCLESLALAGAFDSFPETHRAQYFYQETSDSSVFLEKIIRYGNTAQEQKNSVQQSLFGEVADTELPPPAMPECPEWSKLELLQKEKDVTGIYLSGHPLDDFRFEIKQFCNSSVSDLSDIGRFRNKEITIAGIVTEVTHKTTKTGKGFCSFSLEDYNGSSQLMLFSDDYVNFRKYLEKGWFLYVKGKVQSKYHDENQFEFKVTQIQLLQDVKDLMAKSITLKIPLADLSDSFVNEMLNIITSNPGKCNLKLSVFDPNEKLTLDMPSKKYKVDLNNDFLSFLEKRKSINYTLN